MWYAKCKLLPSNRKTFFIETCTIQYKKIKFVNFKTRFTQFCRKITGYADMLMMYINLPVRGHIQKFTKETAFCNCY